MLCNNWKVEWMMIYGGKIGLMMSLSWKNNFLPLILMLMIAKNSGVRAWTFFSFSRGTCQKKVWEPQCWKQGWAASADGVFKHFLEICFIPFLPKNEEKHQTKSSHPFAATSWHNHITPDWPCQHKTSCKNTFLYMCTNKNVTTSLTVCFWYVGRHIVASRPLSSCVQLHTEHAQGSYFSPPPVEVDQNRKIDNAIYDFCKAGECETILTGFSPPSHTFSQYLQVWWLVLIAVKFYMSHH